MGFLSPVISVNISTSRIVVVRLLSALEPRAGRPASVFVHGELSDIVVLLCCEGWQLRQVRGVIGLRLHDVTQLRMKLLDLVEAPRERGDRVGDAHKWQGQCVPLALVVLERADAAVEDPSGQQLRVAEGVGDPVCGQGVLEVAGITDKGPSRSVTLSKVAPRPTKASQAANQRSP